MSLFNQILGLINEEKLVMYQGVLVDLDRRVYLKMCYKEK